MTAPKDKDLRVDLVSPLPPVRSGIADYCADLLPDLARLCDLRVIHLSRQPIAAAIVERWQPVGPDRVGEAGRLPLYQMGNNPYHEEVLDLALKHPGVLTLHDIFLHHLLIERTLSRRQLSPYKTQLEHDHGWIGAAVALPPRWGAYGDAPLFSLPCHRLLAQSQRGVLVHSQWGAELLREGAEDVEIRVIPMPMPLGETPAPAAVDELRKRWGIPADATVLGSFGFQTPIKRTDVVVRALAQPGMDSVHLLVVGELAAQLDLDREARQAGVRDRLHLCGYVSRTELSVATAAADLCINLRYPTAGETSASLLRLFAQGRPAIVSDYAQFSELSPEVALKVPLGDDEERVLAQKVGEILAEPERLRSMGRAARKMIRQQHAPKKAAAAVYEACKDLLDREPPQRQPAKPPPPTTLTWGRIDGSLTVSGLEKIWLEGTSRRLQIHLRNSGRARWLAGHRGAGGVAVEIQLLASGRDSMQGRPWPALPIDLDPGDEVAIDVSLRRPLGRCKLRIEPHVLGVTSFSALGGPAFEREI